MLRCAGDAMRATLIVAWHVAARSKGRTLVRRLEYDLPPAEGESQAESNRRRDRHRKREEAAIRDLHKWCVGGLPSYDSES